MNILKYRIPKRVYFILIMLILSNSLYTGIRYTYNLKSNDEQTIYDPTNITTNDMLDIVFSSINCICYIFGLYSVGNYYYEQRNVTSLKQQQQYASKEINTIEEKEQQYYQSILTKQDQLLYQIQNDQIVEESIQELDNIIEMKYKAYSNSIIIDAVISSKVDIMDHEQISFDYDSNVIDTSDFQDIDLSTILFNLLDNAIEASKTAETKQIQLSMFYQFDTLHIKIKNNYNKDIDKVSREGHGYGQSIIKDIVKKVSWRDLLSY